MIADLGAVLGLATVAAKSHDLRSLELQLSCQKTLSRLNLSKDLLKRTIEA